MHDATRTRLAGAGLRTLALALLLSAGCASALDRPGNATAPLHTPASGVVGVRDDYFSPDFWVARLRSPDAVLLPRPAIEARNLRLSREDSSMHELAALPDRLTRDQVAGWIGGLASAPSRPLWDEAGKPIAASTLGGILGNRALTTIPDSQQTRFGMTLRRADLRTFPTALRVFNRQGETDIDRFQESALFPGDPVVIAHTSDDGQWLFVVSPRYAAWTPANAIAEGTRQQVLGYGQRAPYRVITGAKPRTVFTREQPQLSELQLDMGLRVPLASVAPDLPVNGQHPYASWIVDLPLRGADGRLAFAPALLPRIADSQADYLPLTRANLIRQSFKFLGERYGWGHAYNARDCSGFVSEIFRSVGVLLPRNTGAQAVAEALDGITVAPETSRARRLQWLREADVGDLVFVPGHVMMIIGHVDGEPWVIHDTAGTFLRDDAGMIHRAPLNGVVVTPTTPLLADAGGVAMIDRITHIRRVR